MGGCEIAMSSNLNSNRRGLPSSPLPVSPGWDFGKKRGLSVESHRGPVGWLLGFQAEEGHSSRGEGGRCPSLLALYKLPVAALLAALLNVWRLTLSAALVWLLPSECYKTARCCQRLSGSLPNLPTAQFYTAPAFCKVFTTLSFFPPSSDLMRELRSQG